MAPKKRASGKIAAAPRSGRVTKSAAPIPQTRRTQPPRAARNRATTARTVSPPPPPKRAPKKPGGRKKAPAAPILANDDEEEDEAAHAEQGAGSVDSDSDSGPVAGPAPPAEHDAAVEDPEIQTDEFRVLPALAEITQDYNVTLLSKGEVEDDRAPENAMLRVRMSVHEDPAAKADNITSRLGYYANISLMHPEEGDAAARPAQVGYIHSWRIDKPTQRTRNPERKTAWRQDFLVKDPYEDTPDSAQETAGCLQALYDQKGEVRKELAGFKDVLDDEPIMFIQMIYVFKDFQGKGLLRPILDAYHDLLGDLPDWYAFDVSVVLVPAKPSDQVRCGSWGKKKEKTVENILIRAYQKYGDYALWGTDVRIGSGKYTYLITVMGHEQLPGTDSKGES